MSSLNFYATNGILHKLSCPRTIGKNGLMECRHRHIVKTGMTLLAHSSTSSKFWTIAFAIFVLLINQLPTHVLQNKSHFELIYSMIPSYNSLSTFDYVYDPHLPYLETTKFDLKSNRCVFLGYPHN